MLRWCPRLGEAMPLILGFAPNWPVRMVMFRIIGTALMLSSAGMWLMPGSQFGADVVLIKLGVSVFFFLCGLALLMRNHPDTRPDACFDPVRAEVHRVAITDITAAEGVLAVMEPNARALLQQLRLHDPEPLLYHNEPILRDGGIVGHLSSGAYDHHLGAVIGVRALRRQGAAEVLVPNYQIDVAGVRVTAVVSLKPPYDAKSERMRT